MVEYSEKHNFYNILGIESGASVGDIEVGHKALTEPLDVDEKPEEEKRTAALAFLSVEAAFGVLSDVDARKDYDGKLKALNKAASSKEKIESALMGKEEQSPQEEDRLQKAKERYRASAKELTDIYYEKMFAAAKEGSLETVDPEQLMEWIGDERAESERKAEQKGRRVSFNINWDGFASVQDKRKERSDEILKIVDDLVENLQL